jgi:hypothetical protein
MAKRRKGSAARPLLIIGIIALAVYAIPRAYFTYRVDQALSRLETGNNPMVSVSYESVWADFMGENADVYGVTIQIRPLNDSVTIDHVRLHAEGYGSLGRLSRGTQLAQVPDSVALEIKGLHLDVDDRIYETLASAADSSGQVALRQLDGLGCKDSDNLFRDTIERVVGNDLVLDGKLALAIDDERGELRPSVALDIHDFARTELAATIRGKGSLSNIASSIQSKRAALQQIESLTLADARLAFEDNGANEARNQLCAARMDTDIDGFVDQHVEAVGDLMARTGERSQEFLLRYREYSRHGGDIQIRMMPGEPLSLKDLSDFTREISIFRMNPEVVINGRSIPKAAALWLSELAITPASDIDWGDDAGSAVAEADGSDSADGEAGADNQAAQSTSTNRNRNVAPGDLASFIGYRARIITNNGETYAGRIASAGDDSVKVRVGMEGGYVGYDIEHGDIREAIVRR